MSAPGGGASPGADVVAELARRFQAGDAAGAFGRVWARSIASSRILGCGESAVQDPA
jgi:hypothetical protein